MGRPVASGLKSPNGSLLTGDGRLILGESGATRLVSFSIKPDGTLGELSVLANLKGSPDGSCPDVAGAVWVAPFGKNRFVRIMDGKVIEAAETPGRHAVARQFGGAAGLTLFCLTYKGALHDIGKSFCSTGRTCRCRSGCGRLSLVFNRPYGCE